MTTTEFLNSINFLYLMGILMVIAATLMLIAHRLGNKKITPPYMTPTDLLSLRRMSFTFQDEQHVRRIVREEVLSALS